MQDYVTRFINGDHQVYVDYVSKSSSLMREFHSEIQKQVNENTIKSYYYMITFTLKNDCSKEEELTIQDYILSQMERPALKIVKAFYVKEKTKQGRAHWHVAVQTKRFLCRNRFNYYCKKYGHIQVSKNHCQTLQEMMNYINKDQQSIQIIPRVIKT